jgi:hypothetical protein
VPEILGALVFLISRYLLGHLLPLVVSQLISEKTVLSVRLNKPLVPLEALLIRPATGRIALNVTLYAEVKMLELEDALTLILNPAVKFIYLMAHVARPVQMTVFIPSAMTLTA